jgi:prepilin-type N-terminal cleavage/methylation domain-containing protein
MPAFTQSGFTLIEIIIVIAIISLVSIIFIPQYLSFSERKELIATGENLQNKLIQLQSQASNGVDRSWYGMAIAKPNILTTLRADNPTACSIYLNNLNSCSPTDLIKETTTLPTMIKITNIELGIYAQDGTRNSSNADYVEIRFNNSPNAYHLLIHPQVGSRPDLSEVVIELDYNAKHTLKLVAKGGNICHNIPKTTNQCDIHEITSTTGKKVLGGSKPGRIYLVNNL